MGREAAPGPQGSQSTSHRGPPALALGFLRSAAGRAVRDTGGVGPRCQARELAWTMGPEGKEMGSPARCGECQCTGRWRRASVETAEEGWVCARLFPRINSPLGGEMSHLRSCSSRALSPAREL